MKELLVEKYRPVKFDGFVFPDETVKRLFNGFVESGNIPNLLIHGPQGIGKTTLIRILINELGVDKSDVKVINASSDRGIQSIRDSILGFCRTLGIGPYKIVVLEEADGLTPDAQKALRVITEDYSDHVRFLMSCNYPQKIIPALHSRFQEVRFDTLDYNKTVERIAYIIDNENIEVDDIDIVVKHIDQYFPDLRKIINSIDQYTIDGKLTEPVGEASSTDNEEWNLLWTKKNPSFDEIFEIVPLLDYSSPESLYRTIYENIGNLDKELRMNAYEIVAEGLYRSLTTADQEITMMSCVVQIFNQ